LDRDRARITVETDNKVRNDMGTLSEFKKFDDVMRKILTVSKIELKKREKEWKRKRERAKKKRALS
jgi:hypothetical protein